MALGSIAAALPAMEFRNAARASLLGAKMVMLLALLRVETIEGCIERSPRYVRGDGGIEEGHTIQTAEGGILGS